MTAPTLNSRRVYYANSKGRRGHHGFNCWGATVFVLGRARRLEWLTCGYMTNWLRDNTVEIAEPSRAGDILSIWAWGLEHTAVWLAPDKYFHKRGSGEAEIVDLLDIKIIYGGDLKYHRLKEEVL